MILGEQMAAAAAAAAAKQQHLAESPEPVRCRVEKIAVQQNARFCRNFSVH